MTDPYVVLIDGVGRPKIVSIVLDEEDALPAHVDYAHEGFPPGPFRAVRFVRCEGHEMNTYPVYRLAGTGDPLVRAEYLKLQPIGPFNGPRIQS